MSSSEVQTRTCESAGRDDDVWPVLPDHKTCLGHAGVHGRRVRAPSWPSSPSLRHVSAGHSNDAEEATDTSRSARASRRDVAGQPEPPDRKRWIAAWGQRVHPLPIPCVERVLPATLKRHGSSGRARLYGTFLYKMVPGVSSLRLPSLARRRGRPRKHGLTTYKSKRSRPTYG